MWHKRSDRPLPALHDGNEIMVALKLHQYYGYDLAFSEQWRVRAVWDGLNEEFYEKITKQYIRDEDIMTWWEDNKNE